MITKAALKDVPSEDLFREFMSRFIPDVEHEHFKDTPRRVIKMYEELLKGYRETDFNLTTFKAPLDCNLVTIKDIDFYSLCSHHLCPFQGRAHISYLPNDKIAGLSKFARTVRHFAAKLQVQEILCEEVATFLQEELQPRALAVVMSASHTCMSMRGIKSPRSKTVTSAMRGLFITDPGLKQEFFTALKLS